MDLHSFFTYTTAVIASCTAVFGLGKTLVTYVIKPALDNIKSHFSRLEKIDEIYAEIKPDNADSMKANLCALRGTVNKIEKRQRAWLTFDEHGVFEANDLGAITWCNRSLLKMLNATFEEIEGASWKNFVYYADREKVYEDWELAVRDKRDYKMIFRFMTSDQDIICVTSEAFIIKDELGAVAGYVGYITKHDGLDKCK